MIHLYATQGVPDVNRVLDVWVAEAHIVGGGLYLAAFRAKRAGSAWQALTTSGALTISYMRCPCADDVSHSADHLLAPQRLHPGAHREIEGIPMKIER